MDDPERLIGNLERRLSCLQGDETPVETIGTLLEDARRLYLRQIDGGRLVQDSHGSWQAFGIVVSRPEHLPSFSGGLLERLHEVIAIAEHAFDGLHPDDRRMMRNGTAIIPTDKELAGNFLERPVYSLRRG